MSKRPYVICHMVATIDGKILSRRWKHFKVAKAIGGQYEETGAEFEVGSWLVGTKTLREFFPGTKSLKQSVAPVPKGNFVANPDAETFAVGLDTNGSVRFDENEIGGDHLIVMITAKVGDAYKAHLRELGISYLICGEDEIDFVELLESLKKEFKIKKILLEGGGLINGAMLQAGLIDEISQLIVPIVDGGGAEISGLYDLRTEAPETAAFDLTLIEQQTLKHGTQWLRYRVKHPASTKK
ncbi:MAG: RibD family protein [Cyanobacteria bacterium SZAS-4]|nr:RibD family protein [Cyanobacteria bacterium SZAS-4]